MCGILAILFIVVPTMELYLLVQIGKNVGASWTLGLILFTGILGAFLARVEGWRNLQKIRSEFAQGIMPGRKLLDGFLILLGAVLLIMPGIITDILGLMMILPGIRYIFREILIQIFKKKLLSRMGFSDIDPHGIFSTSCDNMSSHDSPIEGSNPSHIPRRGDIIDGEVIDDTNTRSPYHYGEKRLEHKSGENADSGNG